MTEAGGFDPLTQGIGVGQPGPQADGRRWMARERLGTRCLPSTGCVWAGSAGVPVEPQRASGAGLIPVGLALSS